MTYLTIKYLHLAAATITISGFIVRGVWMMMDSPKLDWRITRIAPHIIDTLFLLSGIAMLVTTSLNPFLQAWLVAKFAGLLAYVVLGSIAIRRGPTLEIRVLAFVAALSVFAYITGVALSRSPVSWLAYLT